MYYDRLLLLTAVLVPLLPSVVVGMAMCFWLYSRHSLRRRKSSGEKIMPDADGSQQGPGNNIDPAGSAASTTTTRCRRGRLWPLMLERKGKDSLQDVTADDIKGLSKEECLCLFRLLRPATLQQLHGEWQGEILAMGLYYPLAYLFWHWRLGRGWWLGKGIDAEGKQGYNTFYNHGATTRNRRFEVYVGPSAYGLEEEEEGGEDEKEKRVEVDGHKESKIGIDGGACAGNGGVFHKRKGSRAQQGGRLEAENQSDGRGRADSSRIEAEEQKDGRKGSSTALASSGESLHFVYVQRNDGVFRRMHEEVRCVHEGLFLGFGSLGGVRGRMPLNSIPFLLVAPKAPLKRWDQERN